MIWYIKLERRIVTFRFFEKIKNDRSTSYDSGRFRN